MEKYAKLMKGLEMCAGPDCCKDGCPYYGETAGGMTCRARLLADAAIAINNEQNLRESAEEGLRNAVEELVKLHDDVDDLKAASSTLRDERDKLSIRLDNLTEMRDKLIADKVELRKECDMLATRCQVQQNEINALVLKMGKQDGKTDRPSVSSDDLDNLACELRRYIAETGYWHGKADALAAIVERCSFGGGGRHE